jgi:GNAT superfamily N-acetyltransferase
MQPRAITKTVGAQVAAAKILELRKVMSGLPDADILALDPSLGEWLRRPLGREALGAFVMQTSGSTYICLLNTDSAGFAFIARGVNHAQIRALAVARDMRRRGLATTMLIALAEAARARRVNWLWLQIASSNAAAIQCALKNGYKRYLPQYLSRRSVSPLALPSADVRMVATTRATLQSVIFAEIDAGDADVSELVERAWIDRVLPSEAEHAWWRVELQGALIGAAHVVLNGAVPVISLWLMPQYWNFEAEQVIIKTALHHIKMPATKFDLHIGSRAHLARHLAQYKQSDFVLQLKSYSFFWKKIDTDAAEDDFEN